MRVLPVLLVLGLVVYCLIEAAQTDTAQLRLPKPVWLLLILLLPVLGALAWLLVGRPRHGADVSGQQRRPVAPDDDPDFLRKLGRDTPPPRAEPRGEPDRRDPAGEDADPDLPRT
jgi:hypothetical protein